MNRSSLIIFFISLLTITYSCNALIGEFNYSISFKASPEQNNNNQIYPITSDVIFDTKGKYLYPDMMKKISNMSKKEIQSNIVEILAKGFITGEYLPDVFTSCDFCDTTRALFYISLLDYPSHDINCETFLDTSKLEKRRDKIYARRILYDAIGDYPKNSSLIVKSAINALLYTVDPSVMEKYSDLIFKKLNNGEDVSTKFKCCLISLTSVSSRESYKVPPCEKVPRWVKVRQGNKKEEDRLIYFFKNENNYKIKKKLGLELSLAGTKNSLRALAESFANAPDIKYEEGFICHSFRKEIISLLARHFSSDKEFNKHVLNLRTTRVCNKNETKSYLGDFTTWLENKFQIKLDISDSQLYLLKDCTNGEWFCSDHETRQQKMEEHFQKKDE